MKVKPGFKETEVGVIPEDWDVVSTSDACSKIQDGTHFSPRVGGNDYLYITSKNIRFGYLDVTSAPRIDADQHHEIYRRSDVKKGDLLLTKDGANTGNACLNKLNEEFSLLSSVAFLRFQPDKHCAAYFLQQILAPQGQRQIQDQMAGNAITRLTLEKIKKLRFPAPPTKAEEEAIAAALSDVDALITALDRLIAKKRDIKQAAMQELLTGKKRLPGFSEEWSSVCLGELGSFSKGRGIKKNDVIADGLPCVRYGEIYTHHNDHIREFHSYISPDIAAESQQIRNGDLLFAGSGETAEEIGKCVAYLNDKEAYAGGDIIIFTPNRQNSMYFGYLMNHTPIVIQKARMGQGDAVVHISSKNLAQLVFRCPPIEEQVAIVNVLSDMDAEITVLEARRDKTKALKQGMMQELLTGRIRLVEGGAA